MFCILHNSVFLVYLLSYLLVLISFYILFISFNFSCTNSWSYPLLFCILFCAAFVLLFAQFILLCILVSNFYFPLTSFSFELPYKQFFSEEWIMTSDQFYHIMSNKITITISISWLSEMFLLIIYMVPQFQFTSYLPL